MTRTLQQMVDDWFLNGDVDGAEIDLDAEADAFLRDGSAFERDEILAEMTRFVTASR